MRVNLITIVMFLSILICSAVAQKTATASAIDAIISQAAAPKPAAQNAMTLDKALKEAAKQIDKVFAANSRIALVNFDSPSDKFSSYVLDELTANLVGSRRLAVIDRKEVELRRNELNFQMSGDVDDNTIQQLGRTIGAKYIVSGSLTDIGDLYRIVIKALSVENGRVEVQYRDNIIKDNVVKALLAGGKSTPKVQAQKVQSIPTVQANVAPAVVAATAPKVSVAPAESNAKTYKVGDTGPAGGLIFYDKGNNTDGWQYLEAALVDFENLRDVSEPINTGALMDRAVGKGKQNSEAIMKQAMNAGGGFGWGAQAADAYSLNGFDDWFLPSRDELHYMYGNLHTRGLGSFNKVWYMTSTAKEASMKSTCFWYENFSDGMQNVYCSDKAYVRPIRQF